MKVTLIIYIFFYIKNNLFLVKSKKYIECLRDDGEIMLSFVCNA